jgi:response regulator of citrate/malate metabolism
MKRGLSNKIIEFLKKQNWPITTEEVANNLNISWQTAQTRLLKLALENKVKFRKVGRQNQWWLVEKYKKEFE